MDKAAFRQAFPEFVDPNTYPPSTVDFWAGLADKLLNSDRWDDLYTYGQQLFVAHHLAIGERDRRASELGGVPGEVKGPLTSKTVDKVSASYDAGKSTIENAGFWNTTSYGVRFYQLVRICGAGCIQL
jgi:hypothetical protein